MYLVCPKTVVDPVDRFYFIEYFGVDNAAARETYIGKCYAKIRALELSKFQLNKAQSLRSSRKKGEMEHEDDGREIAKLDSSKRQKLKRCKKKKRKHKGHDDDEGETVALDSNLGTLKRRRKNKSDMEKAGEEDETLEFKMTEIWNKSFYAGPLYDLYYQFSAAIAM